MTQPKEQSIFQTIQSQVFFLEKDVEKRFIEIQEKLFRSYNSSDQMNEKNKGNSLNEAGKELTVLQNELENKLSSLKDNFSTLLVVENEREMEQFSEIEKYQDVKKYYFTFKKNKFSNLSYPLNNDPLFVTSQNSDMVHNDRFISPFEKYEMVRNQISEVRAKIRIISMIQRTNNEQLSGIFWRYLSFVPELKDTIFNQNWPYLCSCLERIEELKVSLKEDTFSNRLLMESDKKFIMGKVSKCSVILFNTRNEKKPQLTKPERLFYPYIQQQTSFENNEDKTLLCQQSFGRILRLSSLFSFKPVNISGDGNCFYRSIVRCIFPLAFGELENRLYLAFRYNLNSGKISNKKHPFYDFIEPNINDSTVMQTPGVWADHTQVVKASMCLNLPLWLVRYDDSSMTVDESFCFLPGPNYRVSENTLHSSSVSTLESSLSSTFIESTEEKKDSEKQNESKTQVDENNNNRSSNNKEEEENNRKRLLIHFLPSPGHYESILPIEELSSKNTKYNKNLIVKGLQVTYKVISDCQNYCLEFMNQYISPQNQEIEIKKRVKKISQIFEEVDSVLLTNLFLRIDHEIRISSLDFQDYIPFLTQYTYLILWLGTDYLRYLQNQKFDYIGVIENFLKPLFYSICQVSTERMDFTHSNDSPEYKYFSLVSFIQKLPSANHLFLQYSQGHYPFSSNPEVSSFKKCLDNCSRFGLPPPSQIQPQPQPQPQPLDSTLNNDFDFSHQPLSKKNSKSHISLLPEEILLSNPSKSTQKESHLWKTILTSGRPSLQIRNQNIIHSSLGILLEVLTSFPPITMDSQKNGISLIIRDSFGFGLPVSSPSPPPPPSSTLSVGIIEFMNCKFSDEALIEIFYNLQLHFPFQFVLVDCKFDCSWTPTSQLRNNQSTSYHEIKVIRTG